MAFKLKPIQTGPRFNGPTSGHAAPRSDIAPDCRHYRGDRPCHRNQLCRDCPDYTPYEARLCIVKLGALGDVIRTLCILPELRRAYGDAHITWVTLPNACQMLQGHPLLDRILPFHAMTALVLGQESFDTVICLDKEPEPCALAMTLFARRKLGIGLSPQGKPVPLNPEAESYFQLGLSDDLKFHQNTKTYPQLVHEALNLPWRGERYTLPVVQSLRDRLALSLAARGWQPRLATIGINVGAGTAFANKMWPAQRIVETIRLLRQQQPAAQILLLGGPAERAILDRVLDDLRSAGAADRVFDGGTEHSEQAFVALLDLVDLLFSGDTMAMHVAIALNKGVVAVFGPTCPQEIDLYDRGRKLVAQVPCAPCYKRVCDHQDQCLKAIPAQDAARAISEVLEQVRKSADVPPQRLAG